MANEELIARSKRASSKLFMMSAVCAVMTIPGILLWQNGLAWHMNAWLVYGPLATAGAMAICSISALLMAFRIRREIRDIELLTEPVE